MKKIKYKFLSCQINKGTEENPILEDVLLEKTIEYSEANMEIARAEAVGEISPPFDDGQPETYQPTESERLDALEVAMLEMMGVSL